MVQDHRELVREINSSRCTIPISWRDVPHLTESAMEEMRRATPAHMLSAREDGIPAIGSGRIFPVNPRDIQEKPFRIPDYWTRLFCLDVGIRKTAALWIAKDLEDGIFHIYSEHYQGGEIPSVHASSIKVRGKWIPGVIDPSARNRSPTDGQRLFDLYTAEGLILFPAKNAVESGLYKVNQLFAEDRIRVFNTLSNFFEEIKWYRRDEQGKIVKRQDHLMDALRYGIVEHDIHAIAKPHLEQHRSHYTPGIQSVGY